MGCACVIESDGECPEKFAEKNVTAIKDWCCCECQGEIPKGTKYKLHTGRWGREPKVYRTCPACVEIAEIFLCTGQTFGQVYEDIIEGFGQSGTHDIEPCCINGLSAAAAERLEDFIFPSLQENQWNDALNCDFEPAPRHAHLCCTNCDSYEQIPLRPHEPENTCFIGALCSECEGGPNTRHEYFDSDGKTLKVAAGRIDPA